MSTTRTIADIEREIAETEALKNSAVEAIKSLRAELKEAKRRERAVTTAAIEKLRTAVREGDAEAAAIIARYADDAAESVGDGEATTAVEPGAAHFAYGD